jgi:hypothetical protein
LIRSVVMARANLQRQITVAAREAWMRDFCEQVARFITNVLELPKVTSVKSEVIEHAAATNIMERQR